MKEEHIKKIIKKSTIETSDHFVEDLMTAIESTSEVRHASVRRYFKPVLVSCMVLVAGLSFLLLKSLGPDLGVFSDWAGAQRTPVFVAVLLVLLYSLNSLIKLNSAVAR
ncbi:MAG: hypothetical protein AAF466_06395 [Bacteroidota bacterium]